MLRINIICYFLWAIPLGIFAQRPSSKYDLKLEFEYRKGRTYKEEKYYKNGKLDSIYRKWDAATGLKLTEGYYIEGKRHGEWTEWLSNTQRHNYMRFTYVHDSLKKLYEYVGWANAQNDSIKSREYFYNFETNPDNFSLHTISWNRDIIGKKNAEEYVIIKDKVHLESKKRKVWDKGIPWKQEWTVKQYDQNGKSLGHKKHGHWKLWNEDGTLQKETWYDMGKMLRQKLYEHGKLVSDKKY